MIRQKKHRLHSCKQTRTAYEVMLQPLSHASVTNTAWKVNRTRSRHQTHRSSILEANQGFNYDDPEPSIHSKQFTQIIIPVKSEPYKRAHQSKFADHIKMPDESSENHHANQPEVIPHTSVKYTSLKLTSKCHTSSDKSALSRVILRPTDYPH